jgi:heme-degrading monooxygenase HmoA
MSASETNYKVVIVFDLQPGTADEEIRRSQEPDGMPQILSAQPGFVSIDLVKINEERTMSIQTWISADAFRAAIQSAQGVLATRAPRESILISQNFYAGNQLVSIT